MFGCRAISVEPPEKVIIMSICLERVGICFGRAFPTLVLPETPLSYWPKVLNLPGQALMNVVLHMLLVSLLLPSSFINFSFDVLFFSAIV